jgi:peroxiredoxin
VRNRAARAGVIGLTLALIAGAAVGAEDPVKTLRLTRLPGSELAATFSVATPDRSTLVLGDLRGKVVLLNFWATWCEPCLEEMPALERVGQTYRDRGLVVLALSVDREGASVVAPFVKRHALTFPVGLDAQQAVARLYRVWALPATVIVSRQGIALFSAQGAREWDGPAGHALFETLLKQDS